MRPGTRAQVDTFWADLFGLTVEQLHAPGTKAVDHVGMAGWNGVYLFILDRSLVVSSPPGREIGAGFQRVLGPSVHTYLDVAPDHPTGATRVASYGEVERQLREVCGEADWAESGFAEPAESCFVVEEDGRILAAANLTPWRGRPADVGVLVAPDAYGRGLGTMVAARAAADAVAWTGVARYRALETNHASLAIAAKLGFTAYGRNLVVKG